MENFNEKSSTGYILIAKEVLDIKRLLELDHINLNKIKILNKKTILKQNYIEIICNKYNINLREFFKLNILDEITILNLFLQLFEVLNYLHKIEFIVIDLKPENIYVEKLKDETYRLILDSYWTSTFIKPIDMVNIGIGMKSLSKYISPEVYKGIVQSNMSNEIYKTLFKIDNFSATLIFYELFGNNIDASIGKKMAYEKVINMDKIIKITGIDWFDKVISKSITMVYHERASSQDIKIHLTDTLEFLKKKRINNKFEGKINENNNIQNVIFQKERIQSKDDKIPISKISSKIYNDKELKEDFKKIEDLSDVFNPLLNSLKNTDKLMIVLMGKKLNKTFKNLKIIDFDKNSKDSSEDFPIIEYFIEKFPGIRFILLDIQDDNVTVKICKAFNFFSKLISSNKHKNFILFTYWSIAENETLNNYVKTQLDSCLKCNNVIYITSSGDKSFDTRKNPKFPANLIHSLKLTVGSSNNDKLTKETNFGLDVNYFLNGNTKSITSTIKLILLTNLLWSYNTGLTGEKLLNELKEYSYKSESLNIIDINKSITTIEEKYMIEKFNITTKYTHSELEYTKIFIKFILNLKTTRKYPKNLLFELDYKGEDLNFLIYNEENNNSINQKIEFRKGIDIIAEKTFLYNYSKINSEIKFNIEINEFEIIFIIDDKLPLVFIQNPKLDLQKLNNFVLKKEVSDSNFSSFRVNYKFEDLIEEDLKYENNTTEIKEIIYSKSIAVLFIVNMYKNNQYTLFYNNVYNFIIELQRKGFEIYILSGTESILKNLLKVFNIIKNKSTDLSRFIFYYYGHTKYVNDDNLLDNYSLTAYTEEDEEENLIAHQTLMNEFKKLNFTHKWIILETCFSGKFIEKKTKFFNKDSLKIRNKATYITTALKEISSKGDLIEKIMKFFKYSNISVDTISENLYKESKELGEEDLVKPIIVKDGDGNFLLKNEIIFDNIIFNFRNTIYNENFTIDKFKELLSIKI